MLCFDYGKLVQKNHRQKTKTKKVIRLLSLGNAIDWKKKKKTLKKSYTIQKVTNVTQISDDSILL